MIRLLSGQAPARGNLFDHVGVLATVVLAAAISGGCTRSAAVTAGGTDNRLLFVEAGKVSDEPVEDRQEVLLMGSFVEGRAPGFDVQREEEIARLCGVPGDLNERNQAGFVALAWLAEPIAKYLVGQAQEAVADEIAAYTASYGSKVRLVGSSSFYSETGRRVRVARPCFRFSRKLSDSPEKIAMDFVGLAEPSADGSGLVVRPLRVYLGTPKAKGDEVALVVNMSARASWRTNNTGTTAEVFSEEIWSGKFDLAGSGDQVLYPLEARGVDVPIIPWSEYNGTPLGGGNVEFEVTVSEAGRPPYYLTKISELLEKNDDKIVKGVSDAVKKLAN